MNPTYEAAIRYRTAGLNVVPIRLDGSKTPVISWGTWQKLPCPSYLTNHWWSGARPRAGIGILCGEGSNNLEVLDFDADQGAEFSAWEARLRSRAPRLLDRLPLVATPTGGRHLYYRSAAVQGNLVLARRKDEKQELVTMIETRGAGGLVVAPGSPPQTHSSGQPYRLLHGDLRDVPTISGGERAVLLGCARHFDEIRTDPVETRRLTVWSGGRQRYDLDDLLGDFADLTPRIGDRPGDDFNRRASWEDILEPRGWTTCGETYGETYWCRPGKSRGHSATTNYGGTDLLYVFSVNASPFDPLTSYTKFSAYTLLEHGGDFRAAATELARLGYGTPAANKDNRWRNQ